MLFRNVYQGKKVLLTGNTGFKGAWMTIWLKQLGAEIVGYSIDIPTEPSLYTELNLASITKQYFADINDRNMVNQVIENERPDFIFHFAAQAIVSKSYVEPVETILTNAIGTMNILEALRNVEHSCTTIFITSDKCYENIESIWGYKENEPLGGKDVYSASKACAENIFHSYFYSFLQHKPNLRIGSARAGNVIGGGDWAKDRIIADCVRSWSKKEAVLIRNPISTRPWQHVLEPLSGYLTLGMHLSSSNKLNGESFNFGPRAEQNRTVEEVLVELYLYWDEKLTNEFYHVKPNSSYYEAGLLKLNCDKALYYLNWIAVLDYHKTLKFVGAWYNNFYNHKDIDLYKFTVEQINTYTNYAREQRLIWS